MPGLNVIEHFVVLMLENRSFDNLLGRLYPKGAGFDGLSGQESNPDGNGTPIRVWTSPMPTPTGSMALPAPDPGESFADINQQLFGNSVPGAQPPGMQGFAVNYARNGGSPRDIMHGFRPEQVPALAALARSYAVCDAWFASAPCQTWPNRFFVHTGTAQGYENNSPPRFPYLMPTVFNALDGVVPDGWAVYYHDFAQSLTLARLWGHLDHFHRFDDFLADAAAGTLPSYSFIEPRYFADQDWPSDMHPPHDVGYGDALVAQVYNALLGSPQWSSTMLVVTFDEHGGCYDHVPPPAVVPPVPPRSGQVFAFDRLGVRVPAVVASPWVRKGTVFRAASGQPFDHTAIIKTLRLRYGIAASLTARDAAAPDLGQALTLDAPVFDQREPVVARTMPADPAGLQAARSTQHAAQRLPAGHAGCRRHAGAAGHGGVRRRPSAQSGKWPGACGVTRAERGAGRAAHQGRTAGHGAAVTACFNPPARRTIQADAACVSAGWRMPLPASRVRRRRNGRSTP